MPERQCSAQIGQKAVLVGRSEKGRQKTSEGPWQFFIGGCPRNGLRITQFQGLRMKCLTHLKHLILLNSDNIFASLFLAMNFLKIM